MLESDDIDDVDDDFFTPTSRTNLATIFSKNTISKQTENENPTLKYVAPKPKKCPEEDISKATTKSSPKSSECLLAIAVHAYELVDGNYIHRGKLGLAVTSINTPPQTKLVLYDSSKNVFSQVSVCESLEVNIQKNNYITYLDDLKKYWSLMCPDLDTSEKIAKELNNCGAKIIYENVASNLIPALPVKPPHLKINDYITKNTEQSDKGSDTDSSLNKKTKASILSRMASMGHSILPPQSLNEQTSDSSDTNDYNNHHKISKHKNIKLNTKKVIHEKVTDVALHESNSAIIPITQFNTNSTEIPPLFTPINGQMVPVLQTNISNTTNDSNEKVNILLSEQRVCNSEIRININRISDKLDQVLGKLNSNKKDENPSTFTTDIYKKLLLEYENKIKEQNNKIKELEEKLLNKCNVNTKENIQSSNHQIIQLSNANDIEIESYKKKCRDLEMLDEFKTTEIKKLQAEINCIKANIETDSIKNDKTELLQKINILEQQLATKNFLCDDYRNTIKEMEDLKIQNSELEKKFHKSIKEIMNNTFHTLSANFTSNEQYSGHDIKLILATTIKDITMKNL